MRFLTAVFFVALPLHLASAADEAGDAAERLLRAELLELSAGDLERAMAAYRAIQADEKAPAAVRARAALYLARSHRKLGELEAARKLLDALANDPATERDVQRQARSFLRELTAGKAENEAFDWLKELERNPELQARVFELAMELVEPESEAGKRAYRQLLALAGIASPVIEKVMQVSADGRHRAVLAFLLVQAGRFEQLEKLLAGLETGDPVLHSLAGDFARSLPQLDAARAAALRAALSALPERPETAPYLAALRLWSGAEPRRLAEELRLLEPIATVLASEQRDGKTIHMRRDAFGIESLLERLAEGGDGAAALAARVLEESCPYRRRLQYWSVLEAKAPERLEGRHVAALLAAAPEGSTPPVWRTVVRLEEVDDILPQISPSRHGKALVDEFSRLDRTPDALRAAPPAWAKLLRAAGDYSTLQRFAEANDGAIGEWVDFLRVRAAEAPQYKLGISLAGLRPSAAYAEAMAQLLDEEDPVLLEIVLQYLAIAERGIGPEVLEPITRILLESDNVTVRRSARYALVRRFEQHPETGPAVARALLEDFERWYAGDSRQTARWQFGGAPGASSQPRAVRAVPGRAPRWPGVAGSLPAEWPALLYPHVLELAVTEVGREFHSEFLRVILQSDRATALDLVLSHLERLKAPAVRSSLLRLGVQARTNILPGGFALVDPSRSDLGPVANDPAGLEYLRDAVRDERLEFSARLTALQLCLDQGSLEWLDWPRLLAAADTPPELEGLLLRWPPFTEWLRQQPEPYQLELHLAALESPLAAARRFGVMRLTSTHAAFVEAMTRALDDPDAAVQREAIQRLAESRRVDILPVAARAASEPGRDYEQRLNLIRILKQISSPEALEPLGALLSDPNSEVRKEALEALKATRAVLEERREWEKLIEGLRKKEP
jgi:hypothetical protein